MNKSTKKPAASREVKIFFNGLFYFSFTDGSSSPFKRSEGNVGILSTRRGPKKDHDLFIRYRDAGQLSDYITIPHSVLSTLAPENIEIDKSTPVIPPDVTIRGHHGPTGWGGEPDDRSKPYGSDRYYFKWIIDFEGPRLHVCDQTEKRGSLRPNLKFKTGDFYTAKISGDEYTTCKEKQKPKFFGFASETQGVKISLRRGEYLVVKLAGQEIRVRDTITEIQLFNMRREDVPELGSKRPGKSKPHSRGKARVHLDQDDSQIFYSDLLDRIAEKDRFHFDVIQPAKRSPPFICFGGGGSGGG